MSRAMIGNLPVLSDREFEAAWLRRDYVRYCQAVHHGQWQPGRHHALIAKKLMGIIDGSIKRLMIWMPPRHGKSMEITETFPSFFLGHFPDKHVIEVSYGDELARKFGASNRAKVQEFGGWIFGIGVSQTQGAKTNWDIANHAGGMISVGVGGSMTGKGADLLIVDDPIKNRQEADSVTYRKGLISEWQSTIYTRLHVGGSVIVILTRWHESDFAASLLNPENGEPEEWDVLSLPCMLTVTAPIGEAAKVGTRYFYATNPTEAVEAPAIGTIVYGDEAWTEWDGESKLAVTNGSHMTLLVTDADGRVYAAGTGTITAA